MHKFHLIYTPDRLINYCDVRILLSVIQCPSKIQETVLNFSALTLQTGVVMFALEVGLFGKCQQEWPIDRLSGHMALQFQQMCRIYTHCIENKILPFPSEIENLFATQSNGTECNGMKIGAHLFFPKRKYKLNCPTIQNKKQPLIYFYFFKEGTT